MLLASKPDFKNTWKVATTFIGTIIGAGFASGQEILKFFSHFGFKGVLGLILTCLIFCIAGSIIMLLGHKLQAVSFADVVRYVCGKKLGPVMDLLLTFFLFGTLSVMLAGAGAVFFQQWGLSYELGTSITVIVSILTVLFGLKGIINANTVVVPVMITLCAIITIPAISADHLATNLVNFKPIAEGASSHWLLSALLYAAYNLTLSVSVLAPLGREVGHRMPLLWGGILGGLGLGALAMLINLAILSHYPQCAQCEIPSLFVAGRLARTVPFIFSFILWAEIFTTIIGTIFGLAVRISDYTGFNYAVVSSILMLAALGISQFGFSDLVGTVYPLIGYASLIFLFALFVFPLLNKFR